MRVTTVLIRRLPEKSARVLPPWWSGTWSVGVRSRGMYAEKRTANWSGFSEAWETLALSNPHVVKKFLPMSSNVETHPTDEPHLANSAARPFLGASALPFQAMADRLRGNTARRDLRGSVRQRAVLPQC